LRSLLDAAHPRRVPGNLATHCIIQEQRMREIEMVEGSYILVTGAFGALGRTVAAGLASRGSRIIAIDIAPDPGGLPADVVIGEIDLNDATALAAAIAQVEKRTGGLAGLVNLAGTYAWETISGGSLDTWDRLYRVNLRSAVAMSMAALPLLKRNGGAIVNVGAAAAALPAGAGMAAYAASKAGIAKLTESLAEELKDEGVRVNAVLPTIIDTPANRAAMPQADFSHWLAPAALEKVIAFLLSDESAAITGACLKASGRV
jgi:NAD(P)-dependent dehydrogenase (short-subunit alcohol dehydrogenase family)